MQKILVIEDESAIADTIVYALKTDGFEPLWAATGAEARQRLAGGDIALIILDIGLPDVSGTELTTVAGDTPTASLISWVVSPSRLMRRAVSCVLSRMRFIAATVCATAWLPIAALVVACSAVWAELLA